MSCEGSILVQVPFWAYIYIYLDSECKQNQQAKVDNMSAILRDYYLKFYIFSNFSILKVIIPSCSALFCNHTQYKHPEGVTFHKLGNI